MFGIFEASGNSYSENAPTVYVIVLSGLMHKNFILLTFHIQCMYLNDMMTAMGLRCDLRNLFLIEGHADLIQKTESCFGGRSRAHGGL